MVRETRHLWVGNLPHTIREERILDHFKRYGKVQSVKILPKKDEDSGTCATVAFIDIKSAAKAHNADNKIDERTLKTDYYEPPASSTASSAIFIHERDDTLVRPAPASYASGRSTRYQHGLSEDRNYERPGHYYERVPERESYLRRPIGMGYHDDDNYQGRAKSRDRYSRSTSGNTYTEGTERNQSHFRTHNARQHFDQQRYSVNDQYSEERDATTPSVRLNRRTNSSSASAVSSVASPPLPRSESRPRRVKRRSPSRSPSGSQSNSRSRSRSCSTSGSRSSSSSSKLQSSSSDSSGRSRSPSKSRSPAATYGSQNNTKGNRLDRPASAITNPSSSTCYLPSAVTSSAINCTSANSQGSIPSQGCISTSNENTCDKDDKRPLGICVRNLPVRSTDTSLKDGLFHEYKKHGKVTMVKVIGQGTERYAVVCFKKPEDVEKALEVSKDKLFFGCKIEVTAHEGLDAEDNEFRPLEAELDEFHPKATRTLFIGNLEKDITTTELRKHFDQFGEIIEIDIKKQGTATSYAFIQYSDIASVVKAMRKLDGENLGANRIKLGFGKSMPTNCVWLDGIVDGISEKFLARHFSRFGPVAYSAVDREKGHALVFYDSVEFAQIAVSEMRGRILGGKKLQVDFASRECQTTFFDKLEMTGQMVPGERPWERRERRGEFEIIRDDRDTRVGFENRTYTRYEGQSRAARGNFRGIQRAGFNGRGRGQGFSNRYEVYHDEFGERRHRYVSRDESGTESTTFDTKAAERVKYGESTECPNRKRNKLRNSISDPESHHSQSPPRSRHHSRSISPPCKERKALKDRLHHRIRSPSSHNSSQVNSPSGDPVLDEAGDVSADYRDLHHKCGDGKAELRDILSEITFPLASPIADCAHDGIDRVQPKNDSDSFRRCSVENENSDDGIATSDQLNQLDRKRRLLASSAGAAVNKDLGPLALKTNLECLKTKISTSHSSFSKTSKLNCSSDAPCEDIKSDTESGELLDEAVVEKPIPLEGANPDLKYLQKKQVHILHLLEQLREGVHSSDTEGSTDSDKVLNKKTKVSNSESSFCDNNINKMFTKEESASKMLKSGTKDNSLFSKGKLKPENMDSSNCVSLTLDALSLRKHLDPRKGYDAHTLSMASSNALQKCQRTTSEKGDIFIANSQVSGENFLCVSSAINTDLSWKKQCSSLNDILFPGDAEDTALAVIHTKNKDECSTDEILPTCKRHFQTASGLPLLPLEMPKPFISTRTYTETLTCHEIKREREVSPLSLPLPKFAASLRSPKASPNPLTSPKSSHSPRAGHSPSSFISCKALRASELLKDLQCEKKHKELTTDDQLNGISDLPVDFNVAFESPTEITEASSPLESIQSPKSNVVSSKDCNNSSDSESQAPSPNSQSIEERIKALDEKFNAWSGSSRTINNTMAETTPTVSDVPKSTVKIRSRFSFLTPELRTEPSEIVKSLLAKSTIFDQDSERLEHINEKYDPLPVKMEVSPKIKTTFRTKAAAKEFSPPIVPSLPAFNQVSHLKFLNSVTQGCMPSPPTPAITMTSSVVSSPVTPPTPIIPHTLLPLCTTPGSPPRNNPITTTTCSVKNISDAIHVQQKDISELHCFPAKVSDGIKPKAELEISVGSCSVTLPSVPLKATACLQSASHSLLPNSVSSVVKKEIFSTKESLINLSWKDEPEIKHQTIKKELVHTSSIPTRRDCTFISKDQTQFRDISFAESCKKDLHSKELLDRKDLIHFAIKEECNQWRENHSKDIKKEANELASDVVCSMDISEAFIMPASKKRVSSIDSNESDSGKSCKSLESSQESHDLVCIKQEPITLEPEMKRTKFISPSSKALERSPSPTLGVLRKCEKKDKGIKSEKYKLTNSSEKYKLSNFEKDEHDVKCNNKYEFKEKIKSENSKSKEDRKNKCRDSKDSSKNEQKLKPKEGKGEKEIKSSHSSSSKNKKEPCTNKNEKHRNDKKSGEKSKSQKSKAKQDFLFFEEEPVYFSMYDKVKARSSQNQTLKHQAKDLETMRQKFSKLKQSRAKREEKSKSIDQDSDKESDSASRRSSESDTQAKSSKSKQQRKRKLVIESSSDDDLAPQRSHPRMNKADKGFSDSISDSECEYRSSRVGHAVGGSHHRSKVKKSELLETDSSGSDTNINMLCKTQIMGKKKAKLKHTSEKSKLKILKSDEDDSETEILSKFQAKDHKRKKIKKEKILDTKLDNDVSDIDNIKKNQEELKLSKKKTQKDDKSEFDTIGPAGSLSKMDEVNKEKHISGSGKDKKTDHVFENLNPDDDGKHKSYNKKKKKSKKASKSKERRALPEKSVLESCKKSTEEIDSKCNIPKLLSPKSPKPSSPCHEKPLSPPCLKAGILSDNDFKSDFSDFDFENNRPQDIDLNSDLWPQLETKVEAKISKKKDVHFSSLKHHLEPTHSEADQESSLPSFLEKIYDAAGSEIISESGCLEVESIVRNDSNKNSQFSSIKKEKDSVLETNLDNHQICKTDGVNDFLKCEENKTCIDEFSYSKDDKKKRKSRKQHKEKRRKPKEEFALTKELSSVPISIKPSLVFDSLPPDDDSRLSEIRLDEEIAEEARRLEQELLAASEETSTFGDDGPTKREEKPLERRFEEEAAKETRRLEEELFSTARESWHMKDKPFGSETHSSEICSSAKHEDSIDALTIKDENIFVGLELHPSSTVEPSESENQAFLVRQSDPEQYKLDDKDIDSTSDMESQRKLEDDLAVSALLQEMNNSEISAPELTKETDYLDPLMDSHPEDTMNYLLPDESDNSLHIAENSPDVQASESLDGKSEPGRIVISPSLNSEPPALEISNVEDPVHFKSCETDQFQFQTPADLSEEKVSDDPLVSTLDACEKGKPGLNESKPPVIDMPSAPISLDTLVVATPAKVNKFKKRHAEKQIRTVGKEDCQQNDTVDCDQNLEISDNQLSQFEDITMDNADSKDEDDNPPILQPVDSPRSHISSEKEDKNTTELMCEVKREKQDPNEIIATDSEKSVQKDVNFLSSDSENQKDSLNDIVNVLELSKEQNDENEGTDITKFNHSDNIIPSSTELSEVGNEIMNNKHELSDKTSNISEVKNENDDLVAPKTSSYSLKKDDSEVSVSIVKEDDIHLQNALNTSKLYSDPLPDENDLETQIGSCRSAADAIESQKNDVDLVSCSEPRMQLNDGPIPDFSCDHITNSDDYIRNRDIKVPDILICSEEKEIGSDSTITDDIEETGDISSLQFITRGKPEDCDINNIINSSETCKLDNNVNKDEHKDFVVAHKDHDTSLFHFPLENVQNDFKEKDHSCQTASLNSPQSTTENVTHKHENTVFQNEDQIIPDYGTLNSIPLCDLNGSQMVNPSKQDSTLEVEDPGYRKLQIGDVDSVSSDTIDATISDLKTEVEVDMSVNEEQIQEEQIQEELSTVDDADDKQKLERPRRGRRPKTRKYSESTISLPRYETSSVDFHSNPIIFKATPKRGRPQSSERARRSLRGDIFDQISSDAKCDLKHSSYETRGDSVVLNENDDVSEEISNPFVSDQISVETDNSAASAEVLGTAFNESDSKPLERSQQSKSEEPKRRGRRKKKTSGDLQSISLQCTEKLDLKHDELEHPKDFHRPKESRLWLSLAAEKEQKPSKENTSAYDVFEFRDSEDEELTFERDLQSSVKERLHENNRTSAFSFDQKHDIKSSDIVNDREKKVEENKQKTPLVEDKESGCKEHVPEVNQHRKISITIRLHQKDGHDGTSAGTAEVVKTSEALNIEDTKIDIPKAEKSASAKHEVVSSESPYNGPGKSTRKSTRLMNQAARSTVDEVIEEVIKGNFRSSSVEITPTRMTRRSRSNRRSEEHIPSLPVEISEETVEEKNKNEAVFFIPDNLVKDGTDVKKNQNSTTETIPVSESTTTSEPDKITDRIASLRSFRITRSTANKLENCKENVQSSSSLVMSGGSNENESQKKEMATSLVTEEKQGNCIAVAQTSREHTKENTSVPSLPEIITSRPPLPVLKVELPRVVIPGSRELVNKEDNEDDSDSRSSPAVLIDPVTGFLTPVNKNGEPTVELLENNSLITSTEQKTRHEHNFSNTPSLCTSLITPLKGKASNPKDVSLSTPMEENLGSCKSSLDMSSSGRTSAPSSMVRGNPSESLLPLSTTASIPTTPSCISSTKNLVSPETALFLKCPAISEKDLDLSKATTKKPQTCTHVGVLTVCNPVLSSPSTTAVSLISTSTKTVSSIATNVPSSNASVQPANLMGTLSYGWPQPSPSGGIPAFDRHIPQTMSPVVGKSSHPVVSVSPSSHQPTSRTIVTAVVTVASGIAATSMSSSVPKMQVKSATSTTVGLLQPTHLKSEVPLSHTTAVTRVETVCSTSGKSTITNSIVSSIHSQNISPNLDAPSSNAIVNTTWSSSKLGQCGRIPSNVVDTLPIHHSAVNVSNSTPSTSKLDVRLSQAPKSSHSHASKNNQSFLQQTGFSVPAYESSTHSGTHSIASTSNATGGVIAELLQNPQLLQQHKDYFAAASSNQFQERIQGQMVRPTTPVASGIPPDIATRLGNPTPPHTPTPPVTSSGHSLPPPEMHPAHVAAGLHLRHPSQSPLIVPIPPELNVYVHPQIMYAASHQHYAALHPDIRAQQEAQARAAAAMGISPRFAYPPIPPAAVSSSGFRQPPEPRLPHSSSNDIKLDIKSNSDLSKGVQEQRHMEEKIQHHPIKPIRIKKDDKEMKVIPSDSRADDTEVARSSSTHDKQSSSAAVAPQSVSLRPQHVHYPSAIRQLSPHLTVSPHERITDSPVVATLYATGQGRVPPIPIAGQLDDHKSEGTLLSQTHHLKADSSDRDMKPPIAHQALPSTLPYHTLEPPVHPTARQPLLGVPQVGSPAPGYVDNRSLNQSAHSPGSVSYKKEAVHLQANSMVSSLHTPSTEKRTNHEISKKVVHTRNLSHQGSSISPGPVGLSTAHSPLPWPPVIQSHNTHHSVAPSPSHSLHPPSEQPSRRNPPHATLQMGSDVPVHVPSSAHAMSQPTSIPRTLPQTPPHASQVPSHGDAFILQRYPVMWQGLLALKNDQAAVQMHFVSGNPRIARASLPPMAEGETSPVRIAQRMRLEQTQLEGVARKMQMMDEHCILMALPCGKDHMDVLQQSSNLKNGFINYLQLKQAAGIVNAAAPGTQQPAYVIHIFPSCDFSDNNLARIAPDLLHIICDITHLVIIIATV